ncbi:predicted protein [Chaetomium globosum CBS 148.51]|uniref:Uncharacterized protein n=1 Tax=Chaetomium globosum (strain ATCC 6205 / CBS 148.51 / DSM 1962 / NBRC 6347 / NRRL 1970) TaxID=306901 RepID=Q2GZB0_CHAGB|nr:uncharacterized protein CHGG_05136 [Chaetomium globosum CBS 148.51]EAQ88517.1 predicted protein [Chaetomium globosum CBS 148.51]
MPRITEYFHWNCLRGAPNRGGCPVRHSGRVEKRKESGRSDFTETISLDGSGLK